MFNKVMYLQSCILTSFVFMNISKPFTDFSNSPRTGLVQKRPGKCTTTTVYMKLMQTFTASTNSNTNFQLIQTSDFLE